MQAQVEKVLDEYVRPLLQHHGGDLQVLGIEEGVVRFRFTGACAGCPAADLTHEELVKSELMQRVPGICDAVMVQGVSEDLLAKARELMRKRYET